jgi:hypothetical protein
VLQGRNLNMGDFTTSMVEGFSLAIKDLNENLVQSINAIEPTPSPEPALIPSR